MEALIDGSNISDEKSWNASISSTLRNTGSVELLAGLKVDWLSNTAGFKVETASERPSPHLVRLLLGRQKGLFVIRNQKSNANGYGKPAEALSEERVQAALRSQYAADLMYIPSLCLSKISVIVFVKSIIEVFRNNRSIWMVISGITLWGVAAEIVTALQSHVPRPWGYLDGKCVQMTIWWNYFAASNIATEVVLVALPGIMFSRLQTTLKNKAIVMSYFLIRTFVIVAVIYELVYRNRIDTPHSMVKTWPITICKEVIQCTSIVSASAPQFKAFMESLQSSGLRLYDLPNPKSSGKSGSDGQRYPRTRSPSTLKCLTRPSQEYLEIDSVSGGNTTIDFEATATMDTRNSDWSRDNRPRQPNMI